MNINRPFLVALLGAVFFTSALAQTEADVASLLLKAQRGNSIAQYNLGRAYETGRGVAADPIEAYVWLSLAYEGGFHGKALGNVAGGLDSTQLEAARQRLVERRASLIARPAPATPAKADATATDAGIPVVRTNPVQSPAPAVAGTAPGQNANLAQELATAVADKKELSSELSKSWSETEELKRQLAENQTSADLRAAESGKLHAAHDSLTSRLEELAKENDTLRAANDQASALKAQAETALAQANEQKAALDASLRAARESAATDKKGLSDDLVKAYQENTALKTRLAEAAQAAAATPAAPVYPDLSANVRELNAALAAVSSEAKSAKQEAARLADERIDREKQFVTLQQQAATLATANTVLQQEAEGLRHAATTPVTPGYPDLRPQVATLQSQLSTLQAEAGQAREQVTALTQAKQATEKSLAQKPTAPAYPDLSSKVRELDAALAAVSAEAKSAKQEATRLGDERIDREKQLAALQQQLATLQQQTATLQQQTATLVTAHSTLQQEADSLRHAAATPVIPAYPDLRPQVATLQNQLTALQTEAGQAREQMTALTQAKEAAEKSLAQKPAAPVYPDLSGKVRELDASLAGISAEAKSAKQEATRLADERIDREKQLIELQQQLATLQQQTASLVSAHTTLQQEADNLRHAVATPVAPAYPDLHNQVAALESQLAALKTEAGQARDQLTALTQAKEAAEKSLAKKSVAPTYPDLSSRVSELETSLATQTAAAEKARAAVQAQPAVTAQAPAPAYPDLSGKVQELEASLAARTAETAALGKAADELRQAKADFDQKLAAAEQSRTELTQQFDEFKRSALTNQREHLNRQAQVQMLESEKTALRQQSANDQTRLAELSSQLAASRRQLAEVYPTTPSYPDQRARVEQLEAELTKTNEQANSMVSLLNRSQQEAKASADQAEQMRATIHNLEAKVASTHPSATPAYPDLREQVSNLQIQLDAARALPKYVVSEKDFAGLKQELADTKEKLATTLQGYAVIEKERDTLANRPTPAVVPDQSSRVKELEAQLAAKTAAPTYPDLRTQVADLEATLSKSKSAAPAYPDLREQVSNLEIQLEAARALPKYVVSPAEFAALKQELSDTKEKLETTLRGYSLMEKDRDELAKKSGQVTTGQSDVARLTEAYNNLQRTNAQNERDLVLLRAQLQQAPSANTAVAQQTAVPKITPVPVVPRIVPVPAAQPAPVATTGSVPPPVKRTHIVVAGDTLVKISQRYYGNATNWQPIYNANRDLLGANGTLKVGTELRIP